MSKYNWTLIGRPARGHRIFLDELTGRYAVCDGSGKLPHLAEDGVLWIDRQRPLRCDGATWTVPLLSTAEKETSTLASDDEVKWLIEGLHMNVQFGGDLLLVGHTVGRIPPKTNVGDISVKHITLNDSKLLDTGKVPDQIGVFEYGYVVLTRPRNPMRYEWLRKLREFGMSDAYINLINLAFEQGYYYLIIDRDGPEIENLESFDW